MVGDIPILEEYCDGVLENSSVERLEAREKSRDLFDGEEVIPMPSRIEFMRIVSWFRDVAPGVLVLRDALAEEGEVDLRNIVDTKTRKRCSIKTGRATKSPPLPVVDAGAATSSDKKGLPTNSPASAPSSTPPSAADRAPSPVIDASAAHSSDERGMPTTSPASAPSSVPPSAADPAHASVSECHFEDANGSRFHFVVRSTDILEEWCDGVVQLSDIKRLHVLTASDAIHDGKKDFDPEGGLQARSSMDGPVPDATRRLQGSFHENDRGVRC